MIIDSISGSGNNNYEYTGATPNPVGLNFMNDGSADATITVGSIAVTIKAGENFDGSFDRFSEVAIVATGAWRLVVRR